MKNDLKLKITPCPCNITFHDNDGKEVGKLEWTRGEFTFKGKAKKSAKIFFDFLQRQFDQEKK